MVAIRAKGPQMAEAISTVPRLNKKLSERTERADKLFTELGEMKVEMAEKDKEPTALRAALKKEKKNRAALENAMATHLDFFNREALLAYSVISSALLEVGAETSSIGSDDHQVSEEEFFDWLKVEMANLPNVIHTHSGYAARFTAEAVVGLLEKGGCSDTLMLADQGLVIDGAARDGLSDAGKRGAKRVAMEYWLRHGQSAAKRQALERLAEV